MSVFNHVAASIVVFLRDGKVWLTRRANTGWADGMYCIPGGHAEVDEFPDVTAVREMQEEAGVVIKPADLKLAAICVTDYCKGKNAQLAKCTLYCYVVTQWEGELQNTEPALCDDAGWFALADLPQPLLPQTAAALKAVQDNQFYVFEGTCPDRMETTKVVWRPVVKLG